MCGCVEAIGQSQSKLNRVTYLSGLDRNMQRLAETRTGEKKTESFEELRVKSSELRAVKNCEDLRIE